MKRVLVILLGLSVIIPFVFNKIDTASALANVEYGCIVRPDSNGTWSILNNSNHEPQGCSSVSQTSTYIVVNLSNSLTEVVTGSADADEQLIANQIHAGLSMGLSNFVIYLYDNSGNIVNPSTVTSTSSNVWLFVKGLD